MARKKSTSKVKAAAGPTAVYQLKITLLGVKPPIWRRIQVADGTLDALHEHIQTAMGWTNSHLHDFRVGDARYGDPELMQENFEDMDYGDSTTTLLSEIVPKTSKPFRLLYQYDFGDSWEHEVVVEKTVAPEPGRKYPLCLDGARACPPEDCGGAGGYGELLDILADPSHVDHDARLAAVDGALDPEAFDRERVNALFVLRSTLPRHAPAPASRLLH